MPPFLQPSPVLKQTAVMLWSMGSTLIVMTGLGGHQQMTQSQVDFDLKKTYKFNSHFKVYASFVIWKYPRRKELQGTSGCSITFLEGVRSMQQVLRLTL